MAICMRPSELEILPADLITIRALAKPAGDAFTYDLAQLLLRSVDDRN
jgi:hypothetical protein